MYYAVKVNTRKEVKEKFGDIISPSHFIVKDGKLASKFIDSSLVPYLAYWDLLQVELEKTIKGFEK